MKNNHFPIGFWNYPNISEEGIQEVSRWKRCGITWNMSPSFSYDTNTPDQLLSLLDECERQNITLTLRIDDLNYRRMLTDKPGFTKLFERAYADFGNHPATEGFFIGDEPVGKAANDACIESYRMMLAKNPNHTPFLNFMPYSKDFDKNILDGQPFSEWAKEFTEKSGCKMICYDYYGQLGNWPGAFDGYFTCLKNYSQMAIDAGIDFWVTLLCSAHLLYRPATEDDIRWQLSTAVASGCKGVLWFLFYEMLGNNNYRCSPIDTFGEETETYHYIRRVQQLFHAMYGDLMVKLKFKKCWHFSEAYGEYPLYSEGDHPLIKEMLTYPKNLPGILSRFEDEDGQEYLCFVNNSQREPGLFGFSLKKEVKKITRIQKNGEWRIDFIQSHHDCVYNEKEDRIEALVPLAPGQMEIFQLE